MNTKQWLGRARGAAAEIESLNLARLEEWERVVRMTAGLGGDKVQGTANPHKFDRLAEFDDVVSEKVNELERVRSEIAGAILKLRDERYRRVLFKRYILGKTFREIADEMELSERHVIRLHGHALIAIGDIINGDE